MNRRVLLLAPLVLACGPYFYQAPPPLEQYPQRLPGKGWRDLFAEAKPAAADAASMADLVRKCGELVKALPQHPVAERLAKVDQALEQNREGDYRLRVANFLIELREIANDDKTLGAAGTYLEWRLGTLADRAGFIGSPPAKAWNMTDEDLAAATRDYDERIRLRVAAFDHAMSTAIGELTPNYQVQKAACLFENGKLEEAGQVFAEVAANWPDHPRAEVAGFMRGRCLLEQSRRMSRAPKADLQQVGALRKEAAETFQASLEKYPRGRFVPDLKGWLAAVSADQGDYGMAIRLQMERLKLQPTREVTRSVMRECDQFFAELLQQEHDEYRLTLLMEAMPWAEIVTEPAIARLFVFQALDPAMRAQMMPGARPFEDDDAAVRYVQSRRDRSRPFARQGLIHLGEAVVKLASGKAADPGSLLVLGWASLQGGEAEQAGILFEQALRQVRTDELLQGRAAALAACGRHAEAASAYQALKTEFPDSVIAKNVAFDHAIERFRGGQAGEAFLDLLVLNKGNLTWDQKPPYLHPRKELLQWIDTIAQFGPLDQLAGPLANLPEDSREAELLRGIVRCRALSAGRFDLARRYLDPVLIESEEGNRTDYHVPHFGKDHAHWQQEIESLAGALEIVEDAAKESRDMTSYHLKIGRRWKELRGKLGLPLQSAFAFAESEPEKLDLIRRKNGVLIGLSVEEVTRELDSRDELAHALKHFLEAAKSKDPEIAVPALEEANEAIFRLAEFSQYRLARAVETDAAALSASLVARLKKEYPGRAETARAASWTFTPPAVTQPWMAGDYSSWRAAEAMAWAVVRSDGSRWSWSGEDRAAEDAAGKLLEGIAALAKPEAVEMGEIRVRLAGWQKEFDELRPKLSEGTVLGVVNRLDDLVTAAAVPEINADLFQRYANLRLNDLPPPPAEGEWAPLAPWLAVLELYRSAPAGGPSEESWRRYLMQYPDSPKSEAVSLVLLRQQVRRYCRVPQVERFDFPEAPIPGGYKRTRQGMKPDASALVGLEDEIEIHLKRFPNGRYASDVALLRVNVAIESRNYDRALADLATVLADPMHPELRMNASLHLADCGLRLLDLKERPSVAAAFRKNPAAMPFLKNLVYGDTCLFRLRPMMNWLEEG